MYLKNKKVNLGSAILLAGLAGSLFGCSKADVAQVNKLLNGSATLGPINLADCRAYAVSSDGSRGSVEIGSATTNAEGEYSISIGASSGAAAIVCKGGSYRDEASGADVSLLATDEVVAMVSDISQQSFASVNALTSIAYASAADKASKGKALATAISESKADIALQFKLPVGFDIVGVKPANYSKVLPAGLSLAEKQLGLAMATFSQVAKDKGLNPQQLMLLVRNMSEDYKDGLMDFKVGVTAMVKPTEFPTGYTSSAMITDFAASGTAFLNSSLNYSGSKDSPNSLVAAPAGGTTQPAPTGQ